MKEIRNPEQAEKTPDDDLQKIPEHSSPKWGSNPQSRTGGRLGK